MKSAKTDTATRTELTIAVRDFSKQKPSPKEKICQGQGCDH